MLDDRWPETESGTVVRSYFHLRGANREMQAAHRKGWDIEEVKLNGAVVTENDRRGLLRRSPLARQRDGSLHIRGSSSSGWDHGRTREQQIEVTYKR